MEIVDEAALQIEQDKYTTMIRTAPVQLQAALAGVIEGARTKRGALLASGEAYEAYGAFCRRASLRPLTGRAFGDLVAELDMYSFLQTRVESRGRYGRTRQIVLDIPDDLASRIYETILLNFDLGR